MSVRLQRSAISRRSSGTRVLTPSDLRVDTSEADGVALSFASAGNQNGSFIEYGSGPVLGSQELVVEVPVTFFQKIAVKCLFDSVAWPSDVATNFIHAKVHIVQGIMFPGENHENASEQVIATIPSDPVLPNTELPLNPTQSASGILLPGTYTIETWVDYEIRGNASGMPSFTGHLIPPTWSIVSVI